MKTIQLRVIPGAKKNNIKMDSPGLRVYVTAKAVEGQANKALVVQLAKYLHVKERQIKIIKGLKSRDKTIMIENL